MTEVFVAFYAPQWTDGDLLSALETVTPALRLCISLVNSHVAYSKAEQVSHALLAKMMSHGLGNWSVRARSNALEARDAHARGLGEEFALCMHELLEDCGVGILVAEGVRQHVKRDTPLTIARIAEAITNAAGMDQSVAITADEAARRVRVPHTVLLVISELIDNALRAQRNQGHGKEPLHLTVSLDANARVNIVLRNKGSCTEDDLFLPGRGLAMCQALLRPDGGQLIVRAQDGYVTALLCFPVLAAAEERASG